MRRPPPGRRGCAAASRSPGSATPGRAPAPPPRGVVLVEPREELVDGEPLGPLRHQGLDRDVPELPREAEQPAEDQRLAGYVHAGEVVAGVGLGVALLDGAPQRLREAAAAAQLAE